MSEFFQLRATLLEGQEQAFAAYRGRWVLVVNTASRCGFTPQFEGLEALYRQFGPQQLVILGFPCNQFGQQEPLGEAAIGEFCQRNFGVSFPMFAKVDVNGPQAHPVFVWLKSVLPGWLGGRIPWNFTKFLIDPEGRPVKRFACFTPPKAVAAQLLKAGVKPL